MSSAPFNKIRLFQELQKWPLAELRTLCAYLRRYDPHVRGLSLGVRLVRVPHFSGS